MPPADANEVPVAVARIRDYAQRATEVGSQPEGRRHEGDEGRDGDAVDPIPAMLCAYQSAAAPRYERRIREEFSDEGPLAEAIEDWPGRIGIDPPDEVDQISLVASFYAVLLAAEAVLLATGGETRPIAAAIEAEEDISPFKDRSRVVFADANVAPPVTSSEPPFVHVPEGPGTHTLLRELLNGLESVPPWSDVSGWLGQLYEQAIPIAARKPAGEFFTDGRIARLVAQWVIPEGRDRGDGSDSVRVLDPAAGSGRFLDAVADRLAATAQSGDLVGVDVNPITLHLAAVAHASRTTGLPLRTLNTSFFAVQPTTSRDRSGTGMTDTAMDPATGSLEPVDAVVGNPPFVRTEDLPVPRSHFRAHLDDLANQRGTSLDLSRRADLSAYFLTHASRFLREGGRLGFVVPTKWLTAAYAENLRSFLFSTFAVHAVVGFGQRAFDDALVDAVLVLCERCTDADERSQTPVRFIQVDAPVDSTDLLEVVTKDHDPPDRNGTPAIMEGPFGRTVTRRQGQLRREGPAKLTPYLVAPDGLLRILDDPALCPLGDLATVSRGVMTGANAFFFLSAAEAAKRDIASRFLRRAQKSIRGVDRPVLEPADADHRLVDVHEYVSAMETSPGEGVTAERVRDALRGDGFDALATYIAEAEAAGHHTGRTCARRAVWFDLGTLSPPDIFLPKLLRERVFPVRNRAHAVPSNAVDCLTARTGVDPDLLHGVLLSSVVQTLMEIWGRDEAGMLQLMTYETETLPVPDVRRLAEPDCHAIRQAALKVCTDPASDAAQRQLDAAVATALGWEDRLSPDRIRSFRDRLRNRRLDRGDTVQVLVSESD